VFIAEYEYTYIITNLIVRTIIFTLDFSILLGPRKCSFKVLLHVIFFEA